ncbi:Tetratricopeptide repeat superfamily protein [Perilla frutescens var. hirtella]|uniref:Tetratricopeptide repeat superfamily protein n=1 Tax=Perilla frutescens var. hirtella TaxID=608512 RepID=A0AAD4JAH2_PERFH|nr:Tetratricopeptide repeat superfamily protein [Perilla frutescens var. hirtella]KAH6802922.1 Tetratricopeptide repeat superfamily protein [Perilla frutescens var. frutescens]KAH6806302.1 Tetratricopeptide repeat superfamily protein [Perilla frutescens var. frutescens]KAH6829560.1 Tetratricopeptide repeat superfamily protein [Perilla frutescens var. hirtella]
MTMTMKQGLLTWSPCQWPHSLSRVSHSSLKTPKSLKPNSFLKIFASINEAKPNAGGSTGEDRLLLQSLLPEIDYKERLLSRVPATAIIVTNAIMFAKPLQALAETCEADNSVFNMNMPLLLFFSLVGATVGGLLARQRRGELQRLNEQLRQINTALRRQAKIESYAPTLSYAPVAGRIAEDEVIVDPRKQELISRLKNGKNFLRNQDPEKAFSEFKTALELAQNLEDPIEEKKAARGLGASLQRQGKFRDAVKYHSMVLEISQREGEESGNTEAYGAIADCYTELGDLERAAKYYDQYISRLQSD